MIIGTGTDIIEVDRIRNAMERSSFLKKVFGEEEIKYMGDKESKFQHAAGMYAAKEAVAKALGSGFRGFALTDIQVKRDALGKPYVVLKDGALNKLKPYKNYNINLTISHIKESAIAFAIIEAENELNEATSQEDSYASNIEFLKKHMPLRKEEGHKGTFGRTLIIGGSKGYYGAPLLAARGAARTGSGLVTLVSSEEVLQMIIPALGEIMAASYKSKAFENNLENADAIGVGPGMGTDDISKDVLLKVAEESNCPLVLDADALNVIAKNKNIGEKIYSKKVIITPHPGEMSRLTGESINFINKNRVSVAERYAFENEITVLLKGNNTVITDGKHTYINPTGSSAMASGGMGDCLTGIITSLVGQGLDTLSAGVCGAFIHGYAGEELAKNMHSVLASDVIEKIPYIIKKLIY